MAKHSKISTRDITVVGSVLGIGFGLSSVELTKHYGSAENVLSYCNIADSPNAGDGYQQQKAQELLRIDPAKAPKISYLGAACFTLMNPNDLEKGIDIGPHAFGPGEPYDFYDDCVVFLADKPMVPPEKLRRTQLVIACTSAHEALDA
jgi:hypothetical protein